MKRHARETMDSFKRINDFGVENADDFKPTPPATKPTKAQTLLLNLDDVLTGLSDSSTGQAGGTGDRGAGAKSKAVLRALLKVNMRDINRTADAIATAEDKPEILKQFPLTADHNDAALEAQALAFANAAEPMAAKFIDLGHDTDFVQRLRDEVKSFGEADTSKNVGSQKRSGATANIDALIHKGQVVVKQLDAIAHNLYKANARKMGAWITASHVESHPYNGEKPAPAPTPAPQLAAAK